MQRENPFFNLTPGGKKPNFTNPFENRWDGDVKIKVLKIIEDKRETVKGWRKFWLRLLGRQIPAKYSYTITCEASNALMVGDIVQEFIEGKFAWKWRCNKNINGVATLVTLGYYDEQRTFFPSDAEWRVIANTY